MRVRLTAFVVVLLVIAMAGGSSSLAETPMGTPLSQKLDFFAEHTGVVLVSCNIAFEAVALDYTYKAGKPVLLSGSIGIMGTRGKIGLVMKVVPADVAHGWQTTNFTPALAYASFDGVSTIGQEVRSFRCDNGGVCALYKLDGLTGPFMRSVGEGGKFQIAYQRVSGGLDVVTTIVMPHSPSDQGWSAMIDYSECMVNLLKRLSDSKD